MTHWQTLSESIGSGRVVWIGVRPSRSAPVVARREIRLDPASGISGDHYAGHTQRRRQVTLIQHEHLAVIAALTGRIVIPDLLRRNMVIAGINLHALKSILFRVGDAILQGTGYCHPCPRMESALGAGGYHAMLGHGGITAEIVRGGMIRVDDEVRHLQHD
ncbi:MAG: MOSC domain-containing protein [Methylotetracoccus sp.]|jgi:MOSC domain-containing protein YiiM|nr:MOSC domain-containing protein [Methylotetracoccus sp.]